MSQFQIRDTEDAVVSEDSFGSFDEADVWATEQDLEPGWTMFQLIGGEWTPARRDPSGEA